MDKTYFAGIANVEDLRKEYRGLLKANHPDNGGDVATMQEINRQYDEAFAAVKAGRVINTGLGEAEIRWSSVDEQKIREALSRVVFLDGVDVEMIGCWVWLSGDTFRHKEAIKAAGFRWSGKRKMWHFAPYETGHRRGSGKTTDQLRKQYGSGKVAKERQDTIE